MKPNEKINLSYFESDRHDRSRRFFGKGFKNLQNSTILIIGGGAIGNEVIKNLAMLGVKQVRLVDFDKVSKSNTNRCTFFFTKDHGRPKVEVIKERVECQYDMKVNIYNQRIEETPEKVWNNLDLVILGVDNDMTRLLVNAKILSLFLDKKIIPVINGAMGLTFIECEVLIPGVTACLTCLWTESYKEVILKKEIARSCDEFFIDILPKFPAISTFTSTLGGIIVSETAKILVLPDIKERMNKIGVGYLIRHDLNSYEYSKGSILRNIKKCVEPFCTETFNHEKYQLLWNQEKNAFNS
ncbi:MAG: ThiF family adenylyltransferase [Candidatus Hodarchaeales archaeon]|jgi:adenylyltransferase/sulfurtransferase